MRIGTVLAILLVGILAFQTVLATTPNSAYVISSMDPLIHHVNLETGVVTNDAFEIGVLPNMVRIQKNRGYIVDSDENNLIIFDLQSNSSLANIQLTGDNAWDIGFDGTQRAFVSHWLTANITVVDIETFTVIDSLPCGPFPEAVLVHDGKLYVSCVDYDFATWGYGPGRVEIYDLATLTLENTIWTNMVNPQGMAVDEMNRLHVLCTGDYFMQWGSVEVYDLSTLTLEMEVLVGGSPGQIAISNDDIAFLSAGGWVSDGEVYTYNAITGNILHDSTNPIPVEMGATCVDVSADNHAFVTSLYGDFLVELDENGTVYSSYAINGGLQGVAIYDHPQLDAMAYTIGGPIVIPPGGDWFDFSVSIRNMADFPVLCDFWVEIELPSGSIVDILERVDLEIPGLGMIERDLIQTVPGRAPAGEYTYSVYLGYADTGEILSWDSYNFTKTGSDGSGGDWMLTEAGINVLPYSQEVIIPTEFAIGVYPNPFNPTTSISFDLRDASSVTLAVYDVSGREIARLVDGWRDAGHHDVTFDASELVSGVYIYNITAGEQTHSGKLMLVK